MKVNNDKISDEQISKTLGNCRFFAVLAIVLCHSAFVGPWITLFTRFVDSFANVGVAIFFVLQWILSSFYNFKKED